MTATEAIWNEILEEEFDLSGRCGRQGQGSLMSPESRADFSDFSDEETQRYSRNALLDQVGWEGQARWRAGKVLVVGAGGLGSAALLYLAAAGVGRLGVVDGDARGVVQPPAPDSPSLRRPGTAQGGLGGRVPDGPQPPLPGGNL